MGGPRPLPSQPVRPAAARRAAAARAVSAAPRHAVAAVVSAAALARPDVPLPAPPPRARAARAAADARSAAAGLTHDHARRRHDGQGSGGQARFAGQGRIGEAADEAADADDQLRAGYRDGHDDRTRVRRRRATAQLRGGAAPGGRGRSARLGRGHTRACGHCHGPRRPRQDQSPRCDPRNAGRGARGRRDHAAHRRLPRHDQQAEHRVPRHARPRRVHPDARPRREGDRHRRPRGRGRRWGDAADEGSDRSRQGGQRTDRGGDQQDRQAERPDRTGQARADRAGPDAGRMGRPDRHRRSVGAPEDRHRARCSR